ncbi:Alpha/Beta hydrolase protein [Auriculariales sp. MPI-PUGE-AT-0066]|nr:Alpha/Beta hydrolase protein [Auriculariales sp. MPI-PUGE-AT-0066]
MPHRVDYLNAAGVFVRSVARIPYWSLLYISPSKRPRPTWSWFRAVVHALVLAIYSDGIPTGRLGIFIPDPPNGIDELHVNIGQPNKRKDGAIVVPAASLEKVGSEFAELAARNGVRVGDAPVLGYWYGTRDAVGRVGYPAGVDERVHLNIHGGGHLYDTGGRGSYASHWAHRIRSQTQVFTRLFNVDYRLSLRHPSRAKAHTNPFPAAILDCFGAYLYLIDLGFKPENIILTGDSAGANLALTLTHLLSTVNVALPGRVVVLSPAADWTLSHSGPASTAVTCAGSDYAYAFFASLECADALRGEGFTLEEMSRNMWMCPGGRDVPVSQSKGWFTGLGTGRTRTMILAGGAESSLDGMHCLRNRILADLGTEKADRLVYWEEPDATHDWPNFPIWEPEGARAIRMVTDFIEQGF